MTTNPNVQSTPVDTRDYRDDLRDILNKLHEEKGISRYRIAKVMGIDSGTLSNVLAKRRHFSIDRLNEITTLCGYGMKLEQVNNGAVDARLLPVEEKL